MCAQHGANVGVNYLHSDSAAEELRERFPKNVELLRFDVGNYEQAKLGILRFIRRYRTLDALVNNAGIVRPHLAISQQHLTRANEEFRVNTFGVMCCTQAVLPCMVKNGCGIIINVSSCAVTQPVPGQASYAASKAAVEAYTRAIAVEYARKGVRCVCIRLGPVNTDMLRETVGDVGTTTIMPQRTLVNRLTAPSEIAEIVRALIVGPIGLATGSTLDFTSGYSLGKEVK